MTCICSDPSDGNVSNNDYASEYGTRSSSASSGVSMDSITRDNTPSTRQIATPCIEDCRYN